MVPEDLPVCFAMEPGSLGAELAGPEAAMRVWSDLVRSPAFLARTIVSDDRQRILGFGAAVLMSPELLAAERTMPRLGVLPRFIAGMAEGRVRLPNRTEIARGNADGGLASLFLSGPAWPTSTPEEAADLVMLAGLTCLDAHAGYQIRTALLETRTDLREALGACRVLCEAPEQGRLLVEVSRDDSELPGTSLFRLLFRHSPPVLGFREGEQDLLLAARDGATDGELAARLSISVSAVKKRWLNVFHRVELNRPELFGGPVTLAGERGPQRRHQVLAYVREHPEELRPWAPGS